MTDVPTTAPRHPGIDQTGPVPVKPAQDTVPVEQLMKNRKQAQAQAPTGMPAVQFVPVALPPSQMQPEAEPVQPGAPSEQPQGGKAQ